MINTFAVKLFLSGVITDRWLSTPKWARSRLRLPFYRGVRPRRGRRTFITLLVNFRRLPFLVKCLSVTLILRPVNRLRVHLTLLRFYNRGDWVIGRWKPLILLLPLTRALL